MALAGVVGTPDVIANILTRLLADDDGVVDELVLDELHNVYRTTRGFRDGLMALMRVREGQEGGPNKWLSRVALSSSMNSPLEAYAMQVATPPCVTELSVILLEEEPGEEHNVLCNKFLNAKLSLFCRLLHLKITQGGWFDTLDRPWIVSTLKALPHLVDIELDLLSTEGETWRCFHRVMAEGSLPVTRLRVRFRANSYSSDEYRFNWPQSKLHTLHISFASCAHYGGSHVVTGLDQLATLRELTIKGCALTVRGLPPALNMLHLDGALDTRFLPSPHDAVRRLCEDTRAMMIGRSPTQYTCLITQVSKARADDDFAPLLLLPLIKLLGYTDKTGEQGGAGVCTCVCCHLHNIDAERKVRKEIIDVFNNYENVVVYNNEGSKVAVFSHRQSTIEQFFLRLKLVL